MFKDYKRLFVFDTETSSLSAETGEIIEFGGLLLEREDNEDKFSKQTEINHLIKVNNPIMNSHIHNITNQMCEKDGIEREELYNILKNIFGDFEDTLLIAYNAPFDIRFITEFMRSFDGDFCLRNHILDVLAIAKDRTMTYRGNKLCDMIVKYGVKEENTHRALDDVKATLEVLRKMWLEKNDIEDYIKNK